MRIIQRLAGNTGYLFLDSLWMMVFSVVFYIIVWKSLPPESAGIIATSVNLIILLSTFGIFGMHGPLTKLIPEYMAKRKKGKIDALIKFSNKFLFTINLLVAAGLVASVMFLGVDLKIPFWAVAIVAVGVVFWPMAHATTSILSGYQNMKRIFVTDVVGSIVKVVGAGTSILLGYGFFGPLAAILISFIVLVFLRIDVLQIGRKAGEKIDRSEIIKKYAFPALVASLSWALFINTPTIILTIFDSLRSSGIFAASMTLTNPLTLVPAIIASSIFPITSYLMGVRDHEKKQAALFSLVIRYAVMISVPLLLAYVFFAKALVLVFAQIQYLEAVDLIPIVGVAILVQGIGQIFLQNLFALGKTETNRNVYMATAGIFLATSVPLTMTMGIDGMIYSFLATVSCFALMGYFALRRSLAFKMPWRSIEKVAAASIIFFVILLTPAVMGAKALQLLPFLVIGASVYLWVLGKTRFYIKEDAAILKLLEKKLRPLSGQIAALRRFVERNCGEDFKSISVKAI